MLTLAPGLRRVLASLRDRRCNPLGSRTPRQSLAGDASPVVGWGGLEPPWHADPRTPRPLPGPFAMQPAKSCALPIELPTRVPVSPGRHGSRFRPRPHPLDRFGCAAQVIGRRERTGVGFGAYGGPGPHALYALRYAILRLPPHPTVRRRLVVPWPGNSRSESRALPAYAFHATVHSDASAGPGRLPTCPICPGVGPHLRRGEGVPFALLWRAYGQVFEQGGLLPTR
jgi:hypothetical protein